MDDDHPQSAGRQTEWLLPGAKKDLQSVTRDWQFITPPRIHGVQVHDVRAVPTSYGFLLELYRREWNLGPPAAEQVFQGVLEPGTVSAWHAHQFTTDRLTIAYGMALIVLYDGRHDSPTFGRINEFRIGPTRPAVLLVPPKVWHGVKNLSGGVSIVVNTVDRAYDYENPDHWRLPWNTDQIPYRLDGGRAH